MSEAAPGDASPGLETFRGRGQRSQRTGRMRGVTWAVEHTGLPRKTVQRRADAWIKQDDRSPYALKSRLKNAYRGDRLIDAVDAERVRLQEQGLLEVDVTAEQWERMVARGVEVLGEVSRFVTKEAWFQDLLGKPLQE